MSEIENLVEEEKDTRIEEDSDTPTLDEQIEEEKEEENNPQNDESSSENQEENNEENDESPKEDQEGSLDSYPVIGKRFIPPYNERYYLKYHDSERVTPLDLSGTKNFLQSNGFDGGELKKAREQKNSADYFKSIQDKKDNQMFCSYCGSEITGVEYDRLPDGRYRCNTCSNTVVKTKTEVEEIYKRIILNLEMFFGSTINVPVSIEVIEHRKLKKKAGAIGSIDDQSILVIGAAIYKHKKYSVVLENGAPRLTLIATFAHELTHIWQYTHWDRNKKLKKCAKNKRLIIYEGMAKWVEIQYLYLIGEIDAAKREEFITRNREDEYGIGFRLYEERYPLSREAMICDETPFTTDKYPL